MFNNVAQAHHIHRPPIPPLPRRRAQIRWPMCIRKNGNEILHNEGLDEAKNCESETADKKEEPIVSKSNVIIETQWGTVNNEPTNQLEVEAASPGEADGPEKQRGFRCKFCYFKYREDVAELREHVIRQSKSISLKGLWLKFCINP